MTSSRHEQKRTRQWGDRYGSHWYLHYDGTPPRDDDNDYVWTGTQWALMSDEQDMAKDVR